MLILYLTAKKGIEAFTMEILMFANFATETLKAGKNGFHSV